jgi:hypothetical protein
VVTARFGLKVDDDNGFHVRFRLYAATGTAHLALSGVLTMRPDEYEAFRQLMEPALTDRADSTPAQPFQPGWLQGKVDRSVASMNRLPEGLLRTIRGERR